MAKKAAFMMNTKTVWMMWRFSGSDAELNVDLWCKIADLNFMEDEQLLGFYTPFKVRHAAC